MSLLDRMVAATLPITPKWIVGKVAARYIAGTTTEDAIRCIRDLNKQGFRCTVDVLGEFVNDRKEAEQTSNAYLDFLKVIGDQKLDTNISVKLTAFGLSIDPEFTRQNLRRLIAEASKNNIFVRIDIEDHPYTDETFKIYDEFRKEFKTGVALQAYLRRSLDDVNHLIDNGQSSFRLCKGIYVEPKEIAYKDRQEIRGNYLKLLETMLKRGAYVGIATHDDYLVNEAEKLIKKYNVSKDMYEFQMLLGVRHELRNQIRDRGHHLRIYVPFGEAWYGYSTRRLKENPQIGGYVFKAMLGFGK